MYYQKLLHVLVRKSPPLLYDLEGKIVQRINCPREKISERQKNHQLFQSDGL